MANVLKYYTAIMNQLNEALFGSSVEKSEPTLVFRKALSGKKESPKQPSATKSSRKRATESGRVRHTYPKKGTEHQRETPSHRKPQNSFKYKGQGQHNVPLKVPTGVNPHHFSVMTGIDANVLKQIAHRCHKERGGFKEFRYLMHREAGKVLDKHSIDDSYLDSMFRHLTEDAE